MGKVALAVVSFVVGAAFLWAISHFFAVPYEKGSNSSVVVTNNGVGINQGNGKTMTTLGLANGFPASIPVYKPSQVYISTKNNYYSPPGFSASFVSQSSPQSVSSWYNQALSSNGWHITNQSNTKSSYSFNASGKGYNVSIQITSIIGNNIASSFTIEATPGT